MTMQLYQALIFVPLTIPLLFGSKLMKVIQLKMVTSCMLPTTEIHRFPCLSMALGIWNLEHIMSLMKGCATPLLKQGIMYSRYLELWIIALLCLLKSYQTVHLFGVRMHVVLHAISLVDQRVKVRTFGICPNFSCLFTNQIVCNITCILTPKRCIMLCAYEPQRARIKGDVNDWSGDLNWAHFCSFYR